jgi:hypothetical protein
MASALKGISLLVVEDDADPREIFAMPTSAAASRNASRIVVLTRYIRQCVPVRRAIDIESTTVAMRASIMWS